MTILDEIADYARKRVGEYKTKISLSEVKERAFASRESKDFFNALAKPRMSFICEVKKASPSKGVIDPEFNYLKIASEYEAAGADAVSCLTEPKWTSDRCAMLYSSSRMSNFKVFSLMTIL